MPNSSDEVIFLAKVVDEFVGFFKRMVALAGDFVELFKTEEGTAEVTEGLHSLVAVFLFPLLVGFGIHSLGAFVVGHFLSLLVTHIYTAKSVHPFIFFEEIFNFFRVGLNERAGGL